MLWTPPVPFAPAEDKLAGRLKRGGKFYVFLRSIRERLFDSELQAALGAMYTGRAYGKQPKPPAFVAMVLLLQAYAKVGDEEAIRRVHMDRAWQLALGLLGSSDDAVHLAQSTLFEVRERLIAARLDVRLLARTVELARETGLFGVAGARALRLVIDSAPLSGAGRVEDTINLLGHALRHVLDAIAARTKRGREDLARDAGVPVVCAPSIKAGLDRDWDAPGATQDALGALLAQAASLGQWLTEQPLAVRTHSTVLAAQTVLARLIEQDTEAAPVRGGRQIRPGVAPDRQISLHDPEIRHGRKSQTERIDGYKRYVAAELDAELVVGVCVQPANAAEGLGADAMREEIAQHGSVTEIHVDRAFLSCALVGEVADRGGVVTARPFPPQGPPGFTKEDFAIDLEARVVRCPAGVEVPIRVTQKACFPTERCAACTQRTKCQPAGAKAGRTIDVHPREALLKRLRTLPKAVEGRAALRQRVVIEHKLAHLTRRQGACARYRGARKNEYDLRRAAVIENLFAIERRAGISYEMDVAA